MKKLIIGLAVVISLLALILTGCSTGTAIQPTETKSLDSTAATTAANSVVETTEAAVDTSATVETSASDEASSTVNLSDTVVLPAGWKIQQAMSLEEMGIILGKEIAFYHYGLDNPGEGKPGGGYYITDDPNSASNQIYIKVEVEGGQTRYDYVKGFALDNKTEDIAGIGDKAYLCQTEDAGITFTTLAVLKGNLFFRVEVPTEVWKTLSYIPEQLVCDISYQLLENLYNPARQIPAE